MDKPITTEQVLKDLYDAYYMPSKLPDGWVTVKMAAEQINIGQRAAMNKLNKLVSDGGWESQMALIGGHPTKIYRPKMVEK